MSQFLNYFNHKTPTIVFSRYFEEENVSILEAKTDTCR